jgi:hypothetical protein
VCEDLTTAVVMISVGGPHVFATYTRSLFDPEFPRRQRWLFAMSLLVGGLVVAAAIGSAFFQLRVAGHPAMTWVLTFFFFWAAVHIMQQTSFCVARYAQNEPASVRRRRSWWSALDYLVLFGCLFPASFFRMSMLHPPASGLAGANHDALATQIVVALGGSHQFADEYVFRIGRTTPLLPDFVRADAFWIVVTAGFLVVLALFVVKTVRERRAGELNLPRFWLVTATASVGMFVPLAPNLDTAFQGFNAWHSFQYLGLLWLLNRESLDRGEIRSAFVRWISGPDSALRFYLVALAATLGLIGTIFAVAALVEWTSGGTWTMFGQKDGVLHDGAGTGGYRPGTLLLSYYVLGFSFLLVHYLQDGVMFVRGQLGRSLR